MPRTPAPAGATGIASVWQLPDSTWNDRWEYIFVPDAVKDRLLNYALLVLLNSVQHSPVRFPLHRIALLSGPPGTGKTTLGWGLAEQAARLLEQHAATRTVFVEVDPHAFTSELLGGSQKSVSKLLEQSIPELAASGDPVIVLLDEVENLAVQRTAVSMQANPIDVHRATNAVLTGLDRVSANHPNVLFLCTTNFIESVDSALLSRLDITVTLDKPDRAEARRILVDTIASVRGDDGDSAAGSVPPSVEHETLEHVLDVTSGMEPRRLRKLVLEGIIEDRELALRPQSVSWASLRRALSAGG